MNRVKKLIETIRSLIEGEFSGYIKINFSQGSLGRVEQSEELDATPHSVARKDKNNCENKDCLHGNTTEIRNSSDVNGSFEHETRSSRDRRSGNNHYAGHERRCGVDRRSSVDRRSGKTRDGRIPDGKRENN